jgi:Flp pilus assembly protein protease CpaA
MLIDGMNLFLIVLGLVWIVGAIMQDLRRREVDNIWNFSLIGIALAYRLAVSVDVGSYWFFVNGVIGFLVFLVLGNLFYHMRMFAGGDAKLLIALGAILPLSFDWIVNFKIFGWFILLFLFGGSIYVFIWSLVLVVLNFKKFVKEFRKQVRVNKRVFYLSWLFVLFWFVGSYFVFSELALLGFVFLLFPLLFVFAKSVEESCMILSVEPAKLTEGEWLYEDIFVNGKKIKGKWEGVSASELRLIKEKYRRKILIKIGIPFTPGFLIGFLLLIGLDWFGFLGI